MATGVLVVIAIVVMDLAAGPGPQYIGVLTCAPLLTASLAGPRGTAFTAVVALAAGLAMGPLGGEVGGPQTVRLGLICAAGAVAVLIAAQRVAHERRLERVTAVATIAQQTILRQPPDVIGGYRFATRYVSATTEASVGGDLFEVLDTPWGVRVLLGDVRGKGLEAVQVAALTLGAFREAAYSGGPDLGAVVAQVADSAARWLDEEDFVTALFLELRPDGSGAMIACGHAPPFRQALDGVVSEVSLGEHQGPLGMITRPRMESLRLGEGERLLLYTDGLSEAKDTQGQFFHIEPVLQRTRGLPLDDVAEALLAAAMSHAGRRHHDDVALVLVDFLPRPRDPDAPLALAVTT